MKLIKTVGLVILGHALCDTATFALGRFTEIDWRIAIPNILLVSCLIAFLIERKHTKEEPCEHDSPSDSS